jgi:hypothetical protein
MFLWDRIKNTNAGDFDINSIFLHHVDEEILIYAIIEKYSSDKKQKTSLAPSSNCILELLVKWQEDTLKGYRSKLQSSSTQLVYLQRESYRRVCHVCI